MGSAGASWEVSARTRLVSHELGLDGAAEGYANFDKRLDGWTKVLLRPGRS
ncbi:MAG: hypothetical protein ACR2FG_04905 [Marmoricola sp.]